MKLVQKRIKHISVAANIIKIETTKYYISQCERRWRYFWSSFVKMKKIKTECECDAIKKIQTVCNFKGHTILFLQQQHFRLTASSVWQERRSLSRSNLKGVSEWITSNDSWLVYYDIYWRCSILNLGIFPMLLSNLS